MESCSIDVSEKLQNGSEGKAGHKQFELMNENQRFINKLFIVAEEDNGKLLKKIRSRYDKFVLTNSF